MALAYAMLSVLVALPCSGYDLAKRFDKSVEGSVGFFWNASHQQIYRELNRMEENGWLQAEKVHQENRPDKRIYSVTEAGKQQLQEWILESGETSPFKDELLVKLYAGHLVPREVMLAKLKQHYLQHQQRLDIYQAIERTYFAEPKQLSEDGKFGYLTLQCGIHYERGWLTWCEKAIAFLEADKDF